MDSFPFLIAKSVLLILAAALIVEYVIRRRTLHREAVQNNYRQQQLTDLSQELHRLKKTLARKNEIANSIPLIAKKLTERLPQDALPSIAVRCAKDLFHARQAGFFAPVDDTSDYTLEVGVGFPQDWQGNIRIKSDEGILGMALQKKVVVARVDSLSSAGRRLSQQSLEQMNVFPDFVAPVFGVSGIMGVLVVAGSPLPLDEERKNISMLADLFSVALRNATLIDSGITRTWADHLTGVSNRLHFLQRFEIEIRRAENYGQAISLFMFDIDEFKNINDTYGHTAGDQVIKKLAEIVRHNTRSSDLVGRYGGDEFMVLMTSSNMEQAQKYADQLRGKIAGTGISLPGYADPVRITISGGLAVYPANGITTTELMNAADAALYEAKRTGRNRMIVAQSLGLDGSVICHHAAKDEKIPQPETGPEDGVLPPAPPLKEIIK
ncbi:MAG: GGDEF domain-containing protein [Deltaproteobacteria bacterium]|nr:GGDEF domain-containing protein [Deltaproteobacteria bacterium]